MTDDRGKEFDENPWLEGEDSGDRSPFAPPQQDVSQTNTPSADESVFNEPWMHSGHSVMRPEPEPVVGLEHAGGAGDPEHSVWDEPGLAKELSGSVPEDAITWFRWFEEKVAVTPASKTWLVTITVAVVSGAWAVFGAMFSQPLWQGAILMAVIGAPIVEEIMKVSIAIWVVEKRPWLFKSGAQILLCGAVSGIVFACIENLLYLNVYVSDPEPWLVSWRWSVCVLLHTGCSVIASLGVIRVWDKFQERKQLPQLADGARWIVTAMIVHGLYNFGATMSEFVGGGF